MSTGLVSDERSLWIELGNFGPLSRYSQHFPAMDSPDGKRRILNLLRVSGIVKELTESEPRMVTEEELLRFHPEQYESSVPLNTGAGSSCEYPVLSFKRCLCAVFCLSSSFPLKVNDEPKPSLMQSPHSVQLPLTGYRYATSRPEVAWPPRHHLNF